LQAPLATVVVFGLAVPTLITLVLIPVVYTLALNIMGNTVILDHGLNLFSAYSHLDELLVQEGDWVEKGDIIGKVGSTGFSTGPHVHWTISIG